MTIADSDSLCAEIASLLMFAGMNPVSDMLIRKIIAAVEGERVRKPDALPHMPTPEMIAAAWGVVGKAKLRGGLKRLGPGVGVVEIWQAMAAAAAGADEPSFECKAYDAHCPSMTVRFQIPEGFPLVGGIFRIQRLRAATDADRARFAHLPDAPELSYGDSDDE